MKMTPTKIAEIKRKKEVREKGKPGRFQKPNTQLNPLDKRIKTEPQNPTRTPRLRRPKMGPKPKERQLDPRIQQRKRAKMMGGGMMQMPRPMYGKGGGVCKRGMNRQAIGKNS